MANEPDKRRPDARVGILTFQWADNFGALLQAYGLLAWLSEQGINAFSVHYAPPALKGRDWLFPYAPFKDRGIRDRLRFSWDRFLENARTGRDWWAGKREMRQFRRQYLVKDGRTIYRLKALSRVNMDQLVVGSDQIWNPEITLGFRPAYFGAFQHPGLRKTVAYAASLGTAALPQEEEAEFSQLLASVDCISMREKEAAQYIEARFHREAVHVVDPVFLLSPERWSAIEDRPPERGYVFYYEPEYDEEMRRAACRLAEEKGLKLVELAYKKSRFAEKFLAAHSNAPYQIVYSAGPRQFLGYIHGADYVVTSSFHALAFSILFRRPFYIHNHKTYSARIISLLEAAGLSSRMARPGYTPDIDAEIDWAAVEERMRSLIEPSKEYLLGSLMS